MADAVGLGDPTKGITEENLTPVPVTPEKVSRNRITRYASADQGFPTVSGPQYAARPVRDRSHPTLNAFLKEHNPEYYTDELLQQLFLNDKIYAALQIEAQEAEEQ